MEKKNVLISFLIVMISVFGQTGFAAGEAISVEIKSVNDTKTKVLIDSMRLRTVKTGDILNLGDNCSLEVTQKKYSQAVLNAEFCDNKQLLKKGTMVQIHLSQDQESKDEITPSASLNSGIASKGLRVEFIKSFFEGKIKVSNGTFSDSLSSEVEHDFGLGLGYANIGVNRPGFITRLIFTQFNNKANSIRIDGSGTYGVTENIYFLGGINLHKFTKGADKLDLGFGFQFGAGFQINESFGLGLSYVTLNNRGNVNDVEVEFEAKGLELNVHGTF
ncbi:MAG: hypothetical protein ACXVCY_15240 [Pseudobdellovibrionaceae bacterium]